MSKFKPVIKIAEQDRTDVDRKAIEQIQMLQDNVRETMNTERSAQKRIGLSEIGDPCDKCVARKLSRLYDDYPDNPSWKAQVGTFIHAGLEDHFMTKYGDEGRIIPEDLSDLDDEDAAIYNLRPRNPWDPPARRQRPTDDRPHFVSERHLKVWEYKGHYVGGSCDLFIQGATYGLVVDWKTQGSKKLAEKTASGTIGQTYETQMSAYGLGYELAGFNVTHVLLYALPRDGELDDAKPVLMRYDRSIAVNALKRLQTFIDMAELVGWETVIDTRAAAGFCFGCKDFALAEDRFFHEGLFGTGK